MGWGARAPAGRLVGRVDEQEKLKQAMVRAAAGEPCALVVHGEAGVGKTRLVRDLVDELDAEVLWGGCTHFGASSLPFAPVAHALRTWLLQAPREQRDRVLADTGDLERLLPGLVGTGGSSVRLIPLLDAALNRLARQRLTLLVVDDLHWADVSSLDALAYVIAGLRDQRLAVLGTCRDENRPEGHPLHGWLADMRRMPAFGELHLARLDLAATEQQVGAILGGTVDLELAAQVRERSGGNPYLTELLVRGLDAGARELPRTAPSELREALIARWHQLSDTGRRMMRLLAVGGRPQPFPVLAAVAGAEGIEPAAVSLALAESGAAGVTVEDRGRFWFRHPLLAEVLYDAIPAAEPAAIHASYAALLPGHAGVPEARLAADLAVHHERAGNAEEAFRWSLRAADHARSLHASAEESVHLERACALWAQVPGEVGGSLEDHAALLLRASRSGVRAGRHTAALGLLERAMALVDRERQPLLASSLLSEWCRVRWEYAPPSTSLHELRFEALRLTDGFPDSPERVTALVGLSSAEGWDGHMSASVAHGEEAVRVARRAGSPAGLASALCNQAATTLLLDPLGGLEQATEAARLAGEAGDADTLVAAAIWQVNALQELGRTAEAATVAREAFEEALALGRVHWGFFLAAMAAGDLLAMGRWDEARRLLREALAVRNRGIPGALAHFVAAELAVRTGDPPTARRHLDRALELVDPDFAGLRYNLVGTVVEVLLAEGEAEQAHAWVRARLVTDGALDPRAEVADLVFVARVLAELLQAARDRRDPDTEQALLHELDGWERGFGPVLDTPVDGGSGSGSDVHLARAELARCRRRPDAGALWLRAAQQSRRLGLRWDLAHCLWRAAEAELDRGGDRLLVGDLLREVHALAREMGAVPLGEQVEFLARAARISLRAPTDVGVPVAGQGDASADGYGPLAALTGREREILGHLVAGRTNGEIAHALTISDKTVSVHVSNILRKTGTSTRVEAAALARRMA